MPERRVYEGLGVLTLALQRLTSALCTLVDYYTSPMRQASMQSNEAVADQSPTSDGQGGARLSLFGIENASSCKSAMINGAVIFIYDLTSLRT